MKKFNIKKLTLTALFAAVAVVGSLFSFPVFGAKCAPVQHLVNILCAVLVGPWWGLAAAFIAALIRNLLALGSPLAHRWTAFLSSRASCDGKYGGSLVYICCSVFDQHLRRNDYCDHCDGSTQEIWNARKDAGSFELILVSMQNDHLYMRIKKTI